MALKQKKRQKSCLQIGMVTVVERGVLTFDFATIPHLPPPAFGTFIRIPALDENYYAVIYDAFVKPQRSKNGYSQQNPEIPIEKDNLFSYFSPIGLQAVLIGHPLATGTSHPQTLSHEVLCGKPVFILNEEELSAFADDFRYMKNFFKSSHPIPGDELCVVLIRRFMGYYGNRPDCESLIEKKIFELFRHEPERAIKIWMRIATYKRI